VQTDAARPGPDRIIVTFEQRTRVEGLTNPFRVDELGLTRVLALRTRLQLTVPKVVGPLGAFVELQDSRSSWNDQPFVVPARHVNHLDLLQAQVRLGLGRPEAEQVSGGMLLGRFTLDLGRRRLMARNGMRNTTNAFDGVSAWVVGPDGSSLQAFVSRPVIIEPYSLDRSQSSRVFWGTCLTLRRQRLAQAELLVLRLDEGAETITRRRLTTLGARLYKTPSPGEADYETEVAWQDGEMRGRDHRALFIHLETGLTLHQGRARAALLYDHVSGDHDPDDDRSQRFDTLFGARAFEYAPTGIYGPFFRANIEGPGARLRLAPSARIEALVGYRALWLAEARDAWVGSGLQDPTGTSGRFLGHHLEAGLRWRPRRWLLLETTWGHFFKGSYVDRAPGSPRNPDTDYVTVGIEVEGTLFAR
jgi:hypothetical protein